MKHLPEPWKLEKATIFGDESKFGVAIGSTVRTQFGFIYTKCSELPDGSDVEDSPELEATAQRIIDCVNALAGIENPAKLDFEFIAQALNAHWNAMNWNLTEVKDLGDIERKNYEYAREKAKEQLALLTQ